jgi:hypothetical protein
MAKARQGSAVKKGLKFFLYGKQGTWKSSFALDFMKMKSEESKPLRVFYLDTEYGSIDNYLEDLEAEGIDLNNLFIVYANTYSELEEWIEKAINNEELEYEDDNGDTHTALDADGNPFIADVVVVDSATPVQDTLKYAMIETSEKRAKLRTQKKDGVTQSEIFVAEATAGMEFKDYDKLNAKGKNLLRSLITRTDKYVCVTSREKDLTKQVKKPDGSFGSEKIGVQPDCFKGSQYEFFTVLHMIEDEDSGEIKAQIEDKDRTKVFQRGEIIDSPTPLYWQTVIDGNKGKHVMTTMIEKYDDIVGSEASDMYKNKRQKANQPEVEEKVEKIVEESNVDSIIDEIKSIRNGLTPSKKQALSANFSKNSLPKQPKAELGIETLTKMLEVARETA